MYTPDVSSFLLRFAAVIFISFNTASSFQNISGRVDPDFAVRTTVDITVKRSGDEQYRTMIKKTIEYTYLSERSLEKDKFYIQESPVGTISDLEAEFNKRGLSDQRFSYEVGSSEDVFLSGSKRHTITIPVNINRGDVFTYTYKEEIRDIIFFPLLYISSTDSISSFKTTYHLPDNTALDLHFFFGGDSIPIDIVRSEETVTLTITHLSEKANIPYFPYNGIHATVLAAVRSDSTDITPASVAQLVGWYSKKTPLLPEFDSSDAVSARTLIDTAGTPFERVRSIADYIRKNIRYIADERGMNAYIARSPSFTLKKKYGDCKDKAALGVSFGRLNNVNISMALVSTTPTVEFDRPHMHLYDHVICAYVIDGRTEFFDPTAAHVEFGNIPDRLIGARALILDAKSPRYETIPSPPRQPSLDITIDTHIDSLSHGTAVIVLRNAYAAAARHALRELTLEKWKQYMQEIIASNLFQIRLNDFRFDSEDESSMTVRASAEASKFAVISEPRTYIPQTPFITQFASIMEREPDSLPMHFNTETRLKLRINIRAPRRTVDTMHPLLIGRKDGPWTFASSASQTNDLISFLYEYSALCKDVRRQDKTEFFPFIKQYLSNKKNRFIILQQS